MKLWMLAGLVALLGLPSLALAAKKTTPTQTTGPELKIPSSLERIAALSKVMGEAKEKHKPAVIVISEEGSTKKNITVNTQAALQHARSMGLVVYVDAKELKQLPKNLSNSANDVRGRYPGMIVVNSDTEEPLASIRYSAERNEWEEAIREARRKIRGGETAK